MCHSRGGDPGNPVHGLASWWTHGKARNSSRVGSRAISKTLLTWCCEEQAVDVPYRIADKTTNTDFAKATLDRLAGLTSLGFDPSSDSGFKARPSFRDLMAFTFQPQNIVANPDVMFFKADTTEHREKLKTIFPYVLGAINADLLQARFELDRLNRLLRRKENDLGL